jgi:hypothetical protein
VDDFPTAKEIFLYLTPRIQTRSGTCTDFCSRVPSCFPFGQVVEWPGREGHLLSASSAEIKNVLRYTSKYFTLRQKTEGCRFGFPRAP